MQKKYDPDKYMPQVCGEIIKWKREILNNKVENAEHWQVKRNGARREATQSQKYFNTH